VLSADSIPCEKKNRFLVTFCRSAKSYPLLGAEAFALKKNSKAKALDSRFRGNDEREKKAGFPPSRE
jgi:hypothetical protein